MFHRFRELLARPPDDLSKGYPRHQPTKQSADGVVGEIAQRQDVTKRFMAKIASRAAAAGLLTTQLGTGGGLTLTQPADKITLLQILEDIEWPHGSQPMHL